MQGMPTPSTSPTSDTSNESNTADTSRRGPGGGSLLVIFLTVFVDLLGFGIVIPLLPLYAEHFAVDASGWQLGMLMASFSAMQFLFAPMWGRLSDRVGRRPIIMIGLAGSVLCYVLFGLASIWHSFTLLFVSRIGAGVAGATISTAQAYIADSTSLEQRPKGMALIGMAFGLGFTLGPLIGYLSIWGHPEDPGAEPGWVAAGFSLLALLLAWRLLPESRRPDSVAAHRHWLDVRLLAAALRVPSIALLLVAIFVCVFSFANFETTLALVIKGTAKSMMEPAFRFNFEQVFLTFAYIGVVLALVQGVFVRRVAGRVSEGVLATAGALLESVGFVMMAGAVMWASTWLLWTALTVVVTGFSLLTPSLNSLLSRRSSPTQQGGILGLGQSVSSLARILGAGLGIPLLKAHPSLPYWSGAALMLGGCLLVLVASRSGADYASERVPLP